MYSKTHSQVHFLHVIHLIIHMFMLSKKRVFSEEVLHRNSFVKCTVTCGSLPTLSKWSSWLILSHELSCNCQIICPFMKFHLFYTLIHVFVCCSVNCQVIWHKVAPTTSYTGVLRCYFQRNKMRTTSRLYVSFCGAPVGISHEHFTKLFKLS